MMNFTCPSCMNPLQVQQQFAGKKAKCPKCNQTLLIPQAPESGAPFDFTFDSPNPVADRVPKTPPSDRSPLVVWGFAGGAVLLGAVLVLAFVGLWLARKPSPPQPLAAVEPTAPRQPPAPVPPGNPPEKPKPDVPATKKPATTAAKEAAPPKAEEPVRTEEPAAPPAVPTPAVHPPSSSNADADANKLLERIRPSVMRIEGPNGHGSGFFVGPNVVATNAHVLRDNLIDDVKVRFISNAGVDELNLKARLLFEDKAKDLALLLVSPATNRPLLPVAKDFEAGKGTKIFVIGNPGQGAGLSRSNAIASGTADEIVMVHQQPYIQLNVDNSGDRINVGPGNSGGPVIDHSGRVIGILTLVSTRNRKPLNTAFCIPAAVLEKALDGLGPSSAWDERIRTATARHTLAIAIAHLHLNAQVARAILDARKDIAKQAFSVADVVRLTELDQSVVKLYQEIDKKSQELAQPALKSLTASQALTTAQGMDLYHMRKSLDQVIRTTVMKSKVYASDDKRFKQAMDELNTCFKQLQKQAGLTDEILSEMLKILLVPLNEQIKTRR